MRSGSVSMPVRIMEGVERRDGGAEIAQAEHAAGDGEGEIAEGLVQHDAVVFRPRRREHRDSGPLADQSKVPPSTIDAAHRVAVAAHELGQRVHDDVGAVLDRPAEIGARQRVVDDQRNAVAVRDLGDAGDVADDAAGIGDGSR